MVRINRESVCNSVLFFPPYHHNVSTMQRRQPTYFITPGGNIPQDPLSFRNIGEMVQLKPLNAIKSPEGYSIIGCVSKYSNVHLPQGTLHQRLVLSLSEPVRTVTMVNSSLPR
jgi:hypothetical protein